MKVKYGEIDITELLLEFNRTGDIDQNNLTLLGNTPSYQIDIKIDNDKKVISSSDQLITVYDGEVLKGTYFVYEAPEKYTKILNLTCFDFMLLLNVPYDSKITYPTTIKNQLDEIVSITGIQINYSNIDVLDQVVNWYDNTIACRNYVGWISELCGMNAYADSFGEIRFKPISISPEFLTEDVEDYDAGELFTVSRVCFDNGLLKLDEGIEEGNTLFLSSNNPFIDTENNPLPKIFAMYKGLSIYSVNEMKTAGLDDINLFDTIQYCGYTFICLSLASIYKGGAYQIQEINGVMPSLNADKVTIKYDPTVKIKNIEITLDKNNQSLQIIAKEQDGLNEKFAEFVIDVDSIKQEVKETTEKVESFETQTADLYYYLSTSCTSMVDGSWSTDPPTWVQGKYIWQKTKYTFANGTTKESNPVCLTGNSGQDGNDAILLYIDSSNGNIFKNSGVATTLTAIIIVAGLRLDTSQKLKDYFGEGANIIWKFKRLGETEFNPIDKNDPRLSDGGFIFTLNPDDVQTKHTFKCDLDY